MEIPHPRRGISLGCVWKKIYLPLSKKKVQTTNKLKKVYYHQFKNFSLPAGLYFEYIALNSSSVIIEWKKNNYLLFSAKKSLISCILLWGQSNLIKFHTPLWCWKINFAECQTLRNSLHYHRPSSKFSMKFSNFMEPFLWKAELETEECSQLLLNLLVSIENFVRFLKLWHL